MDSSDEMGLKAQLVNKHIGQILSGVLSPGTRLPSEREIAESLQISRSVVREGLSELAAIGFLSIEARKGTYVNDWLKDGNLLMLNAICKAGLQLPLNLLRGLLSLRMDTLCDSAGKSALLRTDDDLDVMQNILEEQATLDYKQNEDFARLDFLYHKQIYISSGNAFYPILFNSVRELHFSLAFFFYRNLIDKSQIRELHMRMLYALIEQNPTAAAGWTRLALEMGNRILDRSIFDN
ncbi:MAG: GntR family transcriptional regulator [Clostridiales bacterium]|jgi:DNA-binding FadR family transcriptional regulator|nr:GntR family transcriptional regulator [Clostridiales bacterium]